ncbi:50S ribosomal protein L19 [miscellaneous Crenarchaeota group-15 archaeon DG-45]|uniref:Large ribosomal subunit protein eL19 n=1 Tax=miscellaneous Crenarchaeota group-15 archaeon DG-45 TaxID=1685127 RepID=A0A0M0BRW5_9ARCH|nr:MAG: 50S ribosomal protein L19 [miscellaneous Crenarchaeota group-15 archaeon DG-45]
MSLRSQRRLAASILNVGANRVWIDPEMVEDVEAAITRDEIRRLIKEGAIRAAPEMGQSRGRARALAAKKRAGRRRGPGSRKGGRHSVVSRKTRWMTRIRALRRRLRALRERRIITASAYRGLYRKAKGGEFRSIAELERHISEQGLRRRTFG